MKPERDITVYLKDIVESANLIENYVENVSEVAAKHIPEEYRQKWNHISWKEIAGMRDILVHEYFGVTLGMIWKVAIEDIPVLKNQVIELLNQCSSE